MEEWGREVPHVPLGSESVSGPAKGPYFLIPIFIHLDFSPETFLGKIVTTGFKWVCGFNPFPGTRR